MTDREFTMHAAKIKNLLVCKPTKACKIILIHDWSTGFGRCVVEALTWADAKKQIQAAYAE